MKQEFTYTFRPVTPSKLDKLAGECEGKLDRDNDFEVVERDGEGPEAKVTKYKRKPVTVELEVPDMVNEMDDLMKGIVVDYVASYVKSNYIDQFLPVGPHDWETIKVDAQSSRSGLTKVSISDATLKLTAQSFGEYIAQATNSTELGQRMSKVVEGKVTKNAISKYLNTCSPEMIDKLLGRLEQWGEHVSNSGDDDAEELADGYSFINAKLEKLKRSMNTDIEDLVNNVL